jgi:RNA 3'-terminal phosphate cyclase
MKHAVLRRLTTYGDAKVDAREYAGDEAVGQGGAVVVWAEMDHTILGGSGLAERGKPSERVGDEAARALRAELDATATMDVHCADQLLIYLARADGPSRFWVREISGHLQTMMWLLPQFLPCAFDMRREATRTKISVIPKDD